MSLSLNTNIDINSGLFPVSGFEKEEILKEDELILFDPKISTHDLRNQIHNISSSEKSLYEQEKDLLKLTLIDSIAIGTFLLIASPYIDDSDNYIFNDKYIFNIFTSGSIAANFLIRQISMVSKALINKNSSEKTFVSRVFSNVNNIIYDFAPTCILSVNYLTFVNCLVHEYGHYFAQRYYYNFDETRIPSIRIFPGGGFSTIPTTIWEKLKYVFFSVPNISTINNVSIVAAGPAAQLALDIAQITFAHFQTSKPNLKRFLNLSACVSIMNSLSYAYSAFDPEKQNGDYALLWKEAGIHPYVSMVSTVALPLLVKSGLMLYDRYSNKKEISSPQADSIEVENPCS